MCMWAHTHEPTPFLLEAILFGQYDGAHKNLQKKHLLNVGPTLSGQRPSQELPELKPGQPYFLRKSPPVPFVGAQG